MWQKDPTLGKYTPETAETEWNLVFHFACELRNWFPWLDCDIDLTKPNFSSNRPDIILHRRERDFNFLVVEVKREESRHKVPADLDKIRNKWFGNALRYRFGAAMILGGSDHTFEAQVLSRSELAAGLSVLSKSNMGTALPVGRCSGAYRATFAKLIDRVLAVKQRDAEADVSALELEIDHLACSLYVPTRDEIQIVESPI